MTKGKQAKQKQQAKANKNQQQVQEKAHIDEICQLAIDNKQIR